MTEGADESLSVIPIKELGDIIIKIGDREREFTLTGLIRHPFVPPPQFQDLAFFFMDSQGMERFGIPQGQFGAFYVRVTPYSAEHAKEVGKLADLRAELDALKGKGEKQK